MNAKERRQGRRLSDEAVKILLSGPLDTGSEEFAKLIAELQKGHTVWVTPQPLPTRRKAVTRKAVSPSHDLESGSMSFSDVATALSGGAAIGLTALALAPASAVVASIATVVGVCLSGALTRVLDKAH